MRLIYTRIAAALGLGLILGTSACSTLAALWGTQPPVDKKSRSYQVEDLSEENPDWTKLDPSKLDDPEKTLDAPDALSTSASDVAYLSRKDASIISLDSICDPSSTAKDLRASSAALFYGITEVASWREQGTAVQNNPALETTVLGNIYRDPMMLRAVVFRRGSCQFDFLYLAKPKDFGENERVFSSFIASFRLNPGR